MTLVEEDTTLSLVNEKFEELSGYKKEEIEGKMSWTQFVHPDDLERMIHYHYGRRKGENAPSTYEFRFIDRGGNIKNILINISVIPDTKKSVASLVDITEFKKITNLLKAVSEINEVIPKNKSPEKLLEAVSRKLKYVYDAIFTVIKSEKGELKPVKIKGIDLKSTSEVIRNCPSVKNALKGRYTKMMMGDKLCRKCISKPHKYVLSVPIIRNRKIWGALTIHSSSEFSKDEVDLLKRLSKNIAFALNAYKIEEDRKKALEQLAEN
ncbi:MAG TPA: PAS domain S-box protein, partial [Archaeoglobaceae archaeon]|nr:PAS domain S-box protein [Archaeoglobaceae archaeon]